MNAAKIAKLVERIRLMCEESYNRNAPMQYAEMSQIEQMCDDIENEVGKDAIGICSEKERET